MRVLLSAIAVVVVLLPGHAVVAQGRPDLSGKWVLEPFRGMGVGGASHEVVLTQRDGTLTVETPITQFRGAAPGGSSSRVVGREAVVYRLDGEETVRQLDQPVARPGVMTMTTVEQAARAAWMGDQLVIVEHNLSRGFAMDGKPLASRQTVRKSFSLAVDGTLIVDVLIVADPWPHSSRLDPPAITRTVYRKSS